MSYAPEQLPSGRYRGVFRHPVTRKLVRRTFDYAHEAEAWAITAEAATVRAAELCQPDPVAQPVEQRPARGRPAASARWVGPTLREYGDAVLARRRGRMAAATRDNYTTHLRGLGATPFGPEQLTLADRPMGLLTHGDVETWITAEVDAGTGAPTINARLRMARSLFTAMIRDREAPLQLDPTDGIAKLPTSDPETRALTEAEGRALLAAADPELQDAIVLGLDLGLRWQEVFGLRAASVLQDANYVLVSRVVDRAAGAVRGHTKSGRDRTVPTTDRAAAILTRLADDAPARDALLLPALGRTDRVDKDVSAYRPWSYNNHRNRLWLPAMYRAGLAERTEHPTARIRVYGPDAGQPVMQVRYTDAAFGFHALRHTYGSRLAQAGVPRREIQELLGHVDEKTTARYIHAADDGTRRRLVIAALERNSRHLAAV